MIFYISFLLKNRVKLFHGGLDLKPLEVSESFFLFKLAEGCKAACAFL